MFGGASPSCKPNTHTRTLRYRNSPEDSVTAAPVSAPTSCDVLMVIGMVISGSSLAVFCLGSMNTNVHRASNAASGWPERNVSDTTTARRTVTVFRQPVPVLPMQQQQQHPQPISLFIGNRRVNVSILPLSSSASASLWSASPGPRNRPPKHASQYPIFLSTAAACGAASWNLCTASQLSAYQRRTSAHVSTQIVSATCNNILLISNLLALI